MDAKIGPLRWRVLIARIELTMGFSRASGTVIMASMPGRRPVPSPIALSQYRHIAVAAFLNSAGWFWPRGSSLRGNRKTDNSHSERGRWTQRAGLLKKPGCWALTLAALRLAC